MSKIFEALKKAGEDMGDLAPTLLAEEPTTATGDKQPSTEGPSCDESRGKRRSETADPRLSQIQTPPSAFGSRIGTKRVCVPPGAPVLPFDGSHERAAEKYRIIRTKIVQHINQLRMIVVSSPGSGDGKTVSSLNIAGALALKNDATVLVMDGDFRRSTVAKMLGLPSERGLAQVLMGACDLEDAIVRTEQFQNLYVLPAGHLSGGENRPNPAELLDSPRWKEICGQLRRLFRFTIVDAPPIAAVADYDLIQAACDGVILVARQDHTNRALCLQTLEAIPKARLIGVLMNCTEEWFLNRTQDYYYYSGGGTT